MSKPPVVPTAAGLFLHPYKSRQAMPTSIFNDVIGPVMRGPSSSHTAGSYHIGRIVRDLFGAEPRTIDIFFDPEGSYAETYLQQGVDQAFATALMGWEMTDAVFRSACDRAAEAGATLRFHVKNIEAADHPNHVEIRIADGAGPPAAFAARSVGGGAFFVTRVDGHAVRLDGKSHVLLAECAAATAGDLAGRIADACPAARVAVADETGADRLVCAESADAFPPELGHQPAEAGAGRIRRARPVFWAERGPAPFACAADMSAWAQRKGRTWGEAARHYEASLLGMSASEADAEMLRRYDVMKGSVAEGFDDGRADMMLLAPSAGSVRRAVDSGRVAVGGIHARAAAAALAAMHTANSRGVICAAPTGGAAGVLPGVLTALEEAFGIDSKRMSLMLFAAGGVGLVLADRGTFAAEVAGCQVEIGAAAAMAAAAVVEFAGGSPRQACDAAAVSFQNTMGLVCDPVQGMCELPCHTRNAAAASGAFTTADLVLGGYANPVPLDETIDAVYATGLLLPRQLRCTVQGGLALAPSARSLKPRRT